MVWPVHDHRSQKVYGEAKISFSFTFQISNFPRKTSGPSKDKKETAGVNPGRVARANISGLIHAGPLPRNLNFSFWTELGLPRG